MPISERASAQTTHLARWPSRRRRSRPSGACLAKGSSRNVARIMTATALLFRDDPYARACEATIVAVSAEGIVLDRTVFYAQGGGQPGDAGVIAGGAGREIAVANTVYGADRASIMHVPAGACPLAPGDRKSVV